MEDFEYWNIDNLAKTIETQLNIEATNELLEMKTEVDKQLDFGERKTMIRYLYTIVDTSASMKSKDLKPSRMACTFELLKGFIDDFYDKNPLSHLGFGIMKETKMFQLSDLAQSSKEHYVKLQQLKESDSNEISLKNSLDIAMELLKQSPLYSSKEILIILSANSSCDPGDISETIEELKRMKIKVSIIALSCKMFICKKITETTHGNLDLATNKERFRDILLRQATPSVLNLDSIQVTLVPIGFPAKRTEEIRVMKSDGRSETTVKTRTLCSCHPGKMASQHYICPKCKGRNCDIPAKCGICSLNLISASLLARPDPVARFNLIRVLAHEELRDVGMEIEQMELEELLKLQSSCVSCCEPFANSVKNVRHVSVCPNCRFFFCLKCDVYIHDSLFNCPECI